MKMPVRRPAALFVLLAASALTAAAADESNNAARPPRKGDPPPRLRGSGASEDATRQTEADWVDDRWQRTEMGRFLGATLETPRRKTPKGIAIKLGERDEAAVCFDTDLLRYSAGWTGGFVQTQARRYGLMVAPKPAGTVQFTTAAAPGWARDGSFADPRTNGFGPLPRDWARYRGLHLSGARVVLSYTVGGAKVLDAPWAESAGEITAFTRTLELDAPKGGALVRLCDAPKAAGKPAELAGLKLAVLEEGDALTAVALLGRGGSLELDGHAVNLRIAPARRTVRLKALLWHGPRGALPQFAALVKASPPPAPLTPLTRGGPPHWPEPLVTRGTVDRAAGPFAIDTLTVPYENPWRALFFTSGHDFFDNGDAAVCTAHGDVWRVSGIDDKLDRLVWRRFATGLYQPLGLKIVGGRVHVLERDQITVLHDLNGDGEADFYECFNNDCISAGGGHAYAACLETDTAGNFYFVKCGEETPHGGAALRVAKNGRRLDVIATGFRNPNGMGLGPGDVLTVADQQGEWVPETRLDVIRPGGFYGFMPMHHRAEKPTTYDGPFCWIPRALDNSAGGQVWVPPNHWGPLAGQMLHLSYGRCTMLLVLRDAANGGAQGGVVPLPGRFLSGVMRGRFSPRDGHLYLTGLRGWQTAAVRDGCLQRVRYTGAPLRLPVAFALRPNGLDLTFSEPLDRASAEDPDSFGAEQWNYRWSERYGSPDLSPSDPRREGRDEVPIKAARLSPDGRTVSLETPALKPVMTFRLRYNLRSADGQPLKSEFCTTINRIAPASATKPR
jgi:hypothetical protein